MVKLTRSNQFGKVRMKQNKNEINKIQSLIFCTFFFLVLSFLSFNSTSSKCNSGKYSNTEQVCTDCTIGRYQDTRGQDKCKECINGEVNDIKSIW